MKIALLTRQFTVPFVGVDVNADRLRRALLRQGHDVVVLAFDHRGDSRTPTVEPTGDEHSRIWRIRFDGAALPPSTFQHAYDPAMGEVTRKILAEEQPTLAVIMNFYMLTLATVEACKALGVAVAHVATDFLPICRRGTLIRWDGEGCQEGESVKGCAACFVSHRPAGRVAASVVGALPEEALLSLARAEQTHPLGLSLRPLRSYWTQLVTMAERGERLRELRGEIDLVLAPTRYTARRFSENGFRPETVRLLPFGVEEDHPLARLQHRPAGHVRFLFLGRFQPYKGLHVLLDAFNGLARPDGATLTIYGVPDGHDGYFAQLQTMIASNPNVHLGGQLPPERLHEAFGETDYFVLPSTWHENLPLVLLESLQARIPVIASRVGGVSDLVKHETNGLLFEMGSVEGLRACLQRAIDEPALRERLVPRDGLLSVDEYARTLVAHFAATSTPSPSEVGASTP